MNEQAATEMSSDTLPRPSQNLSLPQTQPADVTTPRATKPPRGLRRITGRRGATEAGEEQASTHKRKRVTAGGDSSRMPALRLNRAVGREHVEPRPAVVYDTDHAPTHLRLTRLAFGLVLLAVAWGISLLLVELTNSLVDVFPHQPSLTIRFGLYLLGAIGLAWLGVIALGLIIVGAFSLMLALTRRGW